MTAMAVPRAPPAAGPGRASGTVTTTTTRPATRAAARTRAAVTERVPTGGGIRLARERNTSTPELTSPD